MGMDMYLNCNDMELVGRVQDEYWRARRGIAVYWRNVPAIHGWFMKNVGSPNGYAEGEIILVTVDDLRDLYDTCAKVLEDNDKAAELLPVADGEYDVDFIDDIRCTNHKIGKILGLLEKACDLPTDEGEYYGITFDDDYFFSTNDWIVEFTYRSSY